MTLLKFEGVSNAYGPERVLDDVSFTVAGGELVCLLGPSGCGKTTTLRLASGLETAAQGRILVGERVVADAAKNVHVAPERRGVGLMFQDYALFPHLSVFENITFGIKGNHADRLRWVRQALERMGLAAHAGRYPHTLSGGQQQRVALLRALAPEPRVLLLDEPFSGLDDTLRIQVREETLDLIKETGITTLMVTHDPEEAMFMADTILIMVDGRIVQAGTPVETYLKPANAFVANLLGQVNRLEGTVDGGCVRTPVGCFAAPGLADGTRSQVLIRSEALRLSPADEQTVGCLRVVSARLIGRSSLLRLRCPKNDDGLETIIRARVPGTFLPAAECAFQATVDDDRVYVFPAD